MDKPAIKKFAIWARNKLIADTKYRAGLVGVLRDDDAAHVEAQALEDVHEAQDLVVVGDAQVAADLALLDVVGVDGDDDLHLIYQALEHGDLGIGLEAGEHAAGMVVVEELAAELQVELAAELLDAFLDALGLQADVLLVVEPGAHGKAPLLFPMS